MKRLTTAILLAVVCAVGLTGEIQAASYVAPFWANDPVKWTMHNAGAKTAPGAYKDAQYVLSNDNPWAVDSSAFNKTCLSGATIAVTEADTSRDFSMVHWTFPPSAQGIGSTSLDSTIVCRFFISDAGASATSIDSVYMALQVSSDGKNWVYVNQILNVAGINPITATSAEVLFPLLNAAGATTTTPKIFSIAFHKGLETGHYPYRYNWWQYPKGRVIVIRKHVAGSAINNLNLSVSHWAAEEQDVKN